MLDFANELLQKLLLQLKQPAPAHQIRAFAQTQRISLILQAIGQLKARLESEPFRDEAEEVSFFKCVLPVFISQAIYYTEKMELDAVELMEPAVRRVFGERQLARISGFAKEHSAFIEYFYSDSTERDAEYFLRSSRVEPDKESLLTALHDFSFCPTGSIHAAAVLAYARLESDVWIMLTGKTASPEERIATPKLVWKLPKAALIELIYALHAGGCFGDASLKQITVFFEAVLGIDLGNVTAQFQQARNRKKSTTQFLDYLKKRMDDRLDELDGD